ncbi:hypothetical protein [Gulosibacter bifidus]|uniref:Uncharacterized protein n=1 Tax=Gulosibacter bifidus TaxID=272239 RepID=A0ABW5RH18_9MICO|nr:hypothetical protein [Gulosibacter bifidus]
MTHKDDRKREQEAAGTNSARVSVMPKREPTPVKVVTIPQDAALAAAARIVARNTELMRRLA